MVTPCAAIRYSLLATRYWLTGNNSANLVATAALRPRAAPPMQAPIAHCSRKAFHIKAKAGFRIFANSLTSLSTNRHLSIPIKVIRRDAAHPSDEGDRDPNGGDEWRAPRSRARL
jgi:hypothetical protein